MDPLKDGIRHGSGVLEMTMSLSGPPGFAHHTTLSSDNLHHYMNRQHQQKLVPAGAHDPRALPVDSRGGGGLGGALGLGHDPRVSMDVQHQGRDMPRPTHDARGVESMVSKDPPPRLMSEIQQHHQMSMQQHSVHRVDSRSFADPRVMIPQDKRGGNATDSRSSRDSMMIGDPRGGQLSISSSGRSVRPPQQSSMPPLTLTVYDGMDPGMAPYSSMQSVSGGSILSPHGTGSGKSSLGNQSMTSSQMLMAYSGQKSSRSTDSLIPAGAPIHHTPEHSMYMSGKPSRTYHGDHPKMIPPGHYMSEGVKGQLDSKQVIVHSSPGDQMSPQHRDMMREHGGGGGDIRERELRYSSAPPPMSRSISKSSLELSSNHMKHPVESSLSDARRQEDHMRKSSTFVVGPPPQGMYKPHHGIEPHAGLTKSMTYPSLGVEVSHRGGQAPPSLSSHVSSHPGNLQSISHSSYPSPQSISDRGVGAFSMEQLPSGRGQKSVPRPSMPTEEMSWRDGGYPTSDPSKQHRSVYLSEEMSVSVSKNVLPHMSDLESSHPTRLEVGLPRMQGSISTGQPRIIYDTPKTSNYSEQRMVTSSDRFSTSQRDYVPPRPSSIGRGPPQAQPSSLVMPQEERQQEKSSGGGQIALDLTKLPHMTSKQGDSPLDLTVKTKKRPLDDADGGEYERLVSAAKRPKTETISHSGSMKVGGGGGSSVDMSHNPIWISSPSPRGPESYESLASPSYSSHMSPVSTASRQGKYGYSMDGRISADSRMTSDGRLSVDGRASVESRSSAGCRTPSSPHLHGKFPMVPPPLGKAGSSSVVSDLVKHAGGNPPMVPLTTQLLKVKEEQAHQRKLQRMGAEGAQSPYVDSKRMYKDNLSPRTMEIVAGGANEVIVVRHPQQHYDLSPQHQHQQHSLQYKQQQHHLQQQQQQHIDVHNQQLHQQQQHRHKLNESQEIIELGMKDSSDPLQASRSSFATQGRSFGPGLLQQQQQQQQQSHHQQLYLQQRQMPLKDQMIPLQPYPHSQLQQQQPQYSKEQMMQQSFSKQPSHSTASLQHYQNSLYPGKQNEASGYYQKQLPTPQTKHSEMKPYKQSPGSSQHTPPGNQKWNMQQKTSIKTGYPQPSPNAAGSYFPVKAPSKSSTPIHSTEQPDVVKFGYPKQDRQMKSDFLKSGPLPSIGVREESRRAIRRVSYPSTEPMKQSEGRKESTSSLPEKAMKHEMMVTTPEASATELSLVGGGGSSSSAEKLNDVVKVDDKSTPADVLLISQKKPSNGVSPKDPPTPGQFAVPLSVTIPQSTSPLITSAPSPASCSTPKSTSTNKACWSKKHMILNAVNKDEDLKRIISNTAARKHESGGISAECKSRILASSTCSPVPTSPKMPILSPQEDEGDGANEDLGVRAQANNDDPPTLAPIKRGQGKSSVSRSSGSSAFPHGQAGGSSSGHTSDSPLVKEAYKNNNNNSHDIANNNSGFSGGGGPSASAKDVSPSDVPGNAIVVRRCSLGANQPDHQQPPPMVGPASEDTQKSSSGNVSFPRAEVIRRNYLDGPNWGHVKNIPIANVAPFVHSRVEDEKLKLQKIEELAQLQQQGAAVSAPTYLVQSQTIAPDVKEESPRVKQEDTSLKSSSPGSPDKEVSQLLASSSSKKEMTTTTKKKKLAKLRVSSPTKMKDIESLEYTVLKSSGMDDIKSLDKLGHSAVKKSLENRMKYKHKIVREKNLVMKPKKMVKKRIQYLYDDDDDEPENEGDLFIEDEDDEDFEYEGGGGDKSGKDTSKSDAEAKIRDREERALRREQLRDQSEESTGRHSITSSGQSSVKSKEKNKLKTRTKNLAKPKTGAGSAKGAARISRRRVSSTNQRAQELKHNAIVQRRNTGKRKIRRYNRNAAYEQELHREANRRAVVRAKRQASSKARERLQQQQRDQSLDHENDDTVLDEPWEMSEHKTGARKPHQGGGRMGGKGGSKNSSLTSSGRGGTQGKGNSAGGSGQHKEDYESDVENVPDDLAAEMVSEDGVTRRKKASSRGGKFKSKQAADDDEGDADGGLEVEGDYEADQIDVISSIPVENVPVPADVKKLTINKNSGETLLHRAARIGHEEITLYCLKTKTVHVNARDNAGYTPLHESCVRGSVAVARHLIYYGADVNCCSQDGIRPIHDAIENDHLEVVRLLLVHGADPLIATYAGRTPIRIAKSLPMLHTLQGYISDLNGWDNDEDDDDHPQEPVDDLPWRFTSSLLFAKIVDGDSYGPCIDLPADPQDDCNDVFDDGPTSAINVFNLALEGEDRTPQPFCLLDEVLNRLSMPKDKLTALYPWKPTSVTLSSERVREVASCCCSNVSIRLPQSGKVTLLPFSTLKAIEAALKQQMKVKVKKEEREVVGFEGSHSETSSTFIPLSIKQEQTRSSGDDSPSDVQPGSKSPSSSLSLPSKQKLAKLGPSGSLAGYSSSALLPSVFMPSVSLNSNPGLPKLQKSQVWSTSSSSLLLSSSVDQQMNKKISGSVSQHHQHSAHQIQHSKLQHQPAVPASHCDSSALVLKASSSVKENNRSQVSGSSNPSRKSKKEDSDNPWLNAPMFSDDSSSSPFHTSIDCFDSDNSM